MSRRLFALLLLLAITLPAASALSSMLVPAVDAAGNGVVTNVSVDVKPGSGRVFVDIYPFFSIETQQSSRSAVASATDLAKEARTAHDFYYEIRANAEIVDGPSGGLALALLTYAELTHAKPRPDLTATGTIAADGSAGKVGGVFEKAKAAGEKGLKVFLIPVGQATQDGVDLTAYAPAQWGLQVIEVRSLAEAAQLAFTPAGSALEVPTRVLPDLKVPKIEPSVATEPFGRITAKVVDQTDAAVKKLGPDGALYRVSIQGANTSRYLLGQGYYYSAANIAFLTKITAETALLANASDEKLRARLDAVEKRAAAFKAPALTTANLEWAVGAKLRQYWALDRLNETRKEIATAPHLQTAQGIVISENWLDAAEQLAAEAAAVTATGTPIKEAKLRGYASAAISNADKLVNSAPDGEAALRLKTSREEFSAGEYATAIIDATFAHAFAKAALENADKTAGEAQKSLSGPDGLKKFEGAWAQLYYTHSLYSLAEWNRSGDAGDLLNALKLQQLAVELDGAFKQLPLENSGISATPSAGQGQVGPGAPVSITVSSTPSQPYPDPRLLVLAGIVLIGLAVIALAYGLRQRAAGIRRPSRLALREVREKLDRLDDMLADGKLAEENYNRLRAKYGKRLHELSSQLEAEENAPEPRPKAQGKPALRKAVRRRR